MNLSVTAGTAFATFAEQRSARAREGVVVVEKGTALATRVAEPAAWSEAPETVFTVSVEEGVNFAPAGGT